MLSQELTQEEKDELLRTCRAAAVAVAEYWDVLRGIELRLGKEFDNSLAVIDSLAADCDIALDAVMDVIDEHLYEEAA